MDRNNGLLGHGIAGWIAVGLGGWLLAGYWVARAFGIAPQGDEDEERARREPCWRRRNLGLLPRL